VPTVTEPAAPPSDPGPSISPNTVGELQEIVRRATQTGGRIAVHRAAPPGAVEVVLDRLDRIIEVDADNLLARVEAGVHLGALAGALGTKGLRFIPGDGPFHGRCRVGELYRRGLGHARSLKYGAAKHFLLGSRVVLANGELLATGGRTVKNVTGYDLTRFLNAPLAAFGVTVELTLKLHSVPPARRAFLARFESSRKACAFAAAARGSILPAYLLWMDPQAQRIAGCAAPDAQLVLFELDGVPQEVGDAAGTASVLTRCHDGTLMEVATPALESVAAAFDGLDAGQGRMLANELKVDVEALPGFVDEFAAATRARGFRAGLLGRLAEGVLSVLIETDPGDSTGCVAGVLEAASAAGARLAGNWSRPGDGARGPLPDLERAVGALLDPQGIFAW
jgi:glycolate oxidase